MNSIELPVRELKAAVSGLRQIIPRKVTLPILNTVRIERQLSGRLTLQATDLDSTATYHTQTEPGQPPVILQVPVDELAEALKRAAKDDSLQLASDGDTLRLRHQVAGHWLERPLPKIEPTEWPEGVSFEGEPIPLPPELPATLKAAFDFAADDTRLALHGAWLDVEEAAGHYVMASNGRQLFTANSFTFGLKESLLVPLRRFLIWEGFQQDGPWQLRLRPKPTKDELACLQLHSDHWTFVSRIPDVVGLNWRNSVPAGGKATVRLSAEAVKALTNLLPQLPHAHDGHFRCELRFSEAASSVTGVGREQRNTVELVGVRVTGAPVTIAVNRTYVLQALKLGLHELELTDELSPLVFRHAGRRLVVMPLRPDPLPTTTPPSATPAPAAETSTSPTETPTPEPQSMSPEKPSTTATPATETKTALQLAIEKVEALKESLKGMLTDLNDALKVLHMAQREKRASEKEVEEVRAALEAVRKLRV